MSGPFKFLSRNFMKTAITLPQYLKRSLSIKISRKYILSKLTRRGSHRLAEAHFTSLMSTLSPLVVYMCVSYWALSFLRDRLICVSLLHIQEKSQVWQTTSTQWMAGELTGKGMTERRSIALCLPPYLEASSWVSAEGKEHYQYDSYLLALSLNNNTKWKSRVSWISIFTSHCCLSPSSPVFYVGYCTVCPPLRNTSLQHSVAWTTNTYDYSSCGSGIWKCLKPWAGTIQLLLAAVTTRARAAVTWRLSWGYRICF